jgi:hypothetical protein
MIVARIGGAFNRSRWRRSALSALFELVREPLAVRLWFHHIAPIASPLSLYSGPIWRRTLVDDGLNEDGIRRLRPSAARCPSNPCPSGLRSSSRVRTVSEIHLRVSSATSRKILLFSRIKARHTFSLTRRVHGPHEVRCMRYFARCRAWRSIWC